MEGKVVKDRNCNPALVANIIFKVDVAFPINKR